jgi:hypothetical protein
LGPHSRNEAAILSAPAPISDAGDAQGGGAVVADQPAREADQDGAKVVSHGRYVTFQMAEVAVSRQMFQDILSLIVQLRPPPAPA